MIKFQVEEFPPLMDECSNLIYEHWKAIALDQNTIPLDPDWDQYGELANAGALFIVTARENGELVGYSVYIIARNLHYKGLIVADSDIFWLAPGHRKGMAGIRFLKECERLLKEKGIKKIISKVKIHRDVGVVFERLGYTQIEKVYSKGFS